MQRLCTDNFKDSVLSVSLYRDIQSRDREKLLLLSDRESRNRLSVIFR